MSASEIQTVSREATSKLHVNGNGNLPPDSEKSLDTKAEDMPVTSLETVHLAGDLKMSLDTKPPVVEQPYSMAHSMVDLPCAAYALELFLASHMLESEEYMNQGDPQKYVSLNPCSRAGLLSLKQRASLFRYWIRSNPMCQSLVVLRR